MTPLGKSLIAVSAVALIVAGTLALRPASRPPVPAVAPRLTPAQLAEIQPPKQDPPPAPSVSQPGPPPDDASEPDVEDGNGS